MTATLYNFIVIYVSHNTFESFDVLEKQRNGLSCVLKLKSCQAAR